jgi:hypothetical protein
LYIEEELADRERKGTMRDVVEVYCTVITRNCVRGTEEEHEVFQAGLSTCIFRTG